MIENHVPIYHDYFYFMHTGKSGRVPVFTVSPSSQDIALESDFVEVTLFCSAIGASSYRWERQNGDIPNIAIGIDTSALTFFNLDPKAAGNYRCVATNNHGSNYSDYATITITGKYASIMYIVKARLLFSL